MDESWRMRMRMGMTATPPTLHRPSPAAAARRRNPISDSGDDPLTVEDFKDVFGGPPRTILSRQFSTSYFYEEIFRPPSTAEQARRTGRSLPEFRIPGDRRWEKDGFYRDVFGWEDEKVVRSRSRSKTGSSSGLSLEELSPLRRMFSVDGDDNVSTFASKLRPINVRSKWDLTRTRDEEQQNLMPPFSNTKSFQCRNASQETISFNVSADDIELNSPSSPVSSGCNPSVQKVDDNDNDNEVSDYEEEDDAMNSYVIEIVSNREETCESNGVDEAIAWAKEKFQTSSQNLNGHQVPEVYTDSFTSMDRDEEVVVSKSEQSQTELDILDEKIRLWSTGKETDIRLLLSSLHHILWPESGWLPMRASNINESSRVKKAYQKARLCLHPDKLQQRGATLQQKYIAEKAFSILQDAWAAFISLDVF